MAKKKTKNDPAPETAGADAPQAAQATPAGPPPTDYVRVVNRTKTKQDLPLATGENVPLYPRTPGREIHISRPILRKHIGAPIRRLEKRGIVAVIQNEGV